MKLYMMKKLSYLADKIKSASVFIKITLIFEVALIVTVIFAASFVSYSFTGVLLEKEIELGDARIEKFVNYIQEKYNRVYSLSNYIHSSDLSSVLSDIAQDEKQAYEIETIKFMNVFFSGVSSADSDISDVIIISTKDIVYSYTDRAVAEVKPSYPFMSDSLVQEFVRSDDDMKIFYDAPGRYCLKEREAVISFMGKIYDPSRFPRKMLVGIYIMNVPVSIIDSRFDLKKGKVWISLVNKENQVLYSTISDQMGNSFVPQKKEEEDYAGEREIGTSTLKIKYALSEEMLYYEANQLKRGIILVLLAAICTTGILFISIYKSYHRRIQVLMDFMSKIECGDLKSRVPVTSKDEIGVLIQSCNEMCEKLNFYIAKVYIEELQRKNAEINALQMQIEPHFLYNTLESIKANALKEGDITTSEMVVLLGNLFRWTSRTDKKFVTIEEELDYVHTYLKLQSYRYEMPLDIDIQVEEEDLDAAIPKLTLQPIIENIMIHGFTHIKRRGIVGIIVKRKKNDIEITVFDNGQGMMPEVLESIRQKLSMEMNQDAFQSIGIQNVHRRLQLLFGKEYGLQIMSIWEQGTAAKVVIPALSRKEMENLSLSVRGSGKNVRKYV